MTTLLPIFDQIFENSRFKNGPALDLEATFPGLHRWGFHVPLPPKSLFPSLPPPLAGAKHPIAELVRREK